MTTPRPVAPRQLGATGPRVFPFALGCMGMSGIYGPADDAESVATIHEALDRGVTLLDTGDFYGSGRNELLIGRALQGRRREQVLLSVKFGAMRTPGGGWGPFDGRSSRREKLGLQPRAPRRGLRRHLPAGAARPGGADRGHRRRDRRTQAGRPGAAHRAVGSGTRHHPPRARHPSDCRSADRILAGQTRSGAGDLPGAGRAWHRGDGLWRAFARAARRVKAGRADRPPRAPAAFHRRQRRAKRTGRCGVRPAGGEMGAAPSQFAIAWVLAKNRTLCPSWVRAGAPSSPSRSPPSIFNSQPRTSHESRQRCRRRPWPATVMLRRRWRCSTAKSEPAPGRADTAAAGTLHAPDARWVISFPIPGRGPSAIPAAAARTAVAQASPDRRTSRTPRTAVAQRLPRAMQRFSSRNQESDPSTRVIASDRNKLKSGPRCA